jgi:type II secretory pathway pseudopilin PulG
MSVDRYLGPGCVSVYPFTYTPSVLRFTDKENNECEREVIGNQLREQIDLFGQKVNYWQNPYSTLSADNIYGEDPTRNWPEPKSIIMGIKLDEDNLTINQFGFDAQDYMTATVAISSFYSVFGPGQEPKSGDIIKLTEYGNDRPGDRDGKLFEVTQRLDSENSTINPLASHYLWFLKLKRFDYSEEVNLPNEKGNLQVMDNTGYGTLSATLSGEQPDKPRPETLGNSAQEVTKRFVFDYSGTSNDNVYGTYDVHTGE